ncbi:MAG: hypothetical protein M0P02_01080 [Sulfurospirillaceae bacterium]|nr:hypothetical protein [Sulfurospirillaceae bacterium]MCK9545514.1 hypothetical protein [Sulfurospirillaceae bacterium]
MQPENFIYFLTVCGFFIGIMFSVASGYEAFEILLYTLEITLFFYLFAHVAIMNFVDIRQVGKKLFDHKQYEEISSYFIFELQEREKRMDALLRNDEVEPKELKKMRRDEPIRKKAA